VLGYRDIWPSNDITPFVMTHEYSSICSLFFLWIITQRTCCFCR
jgi:hypothetical protein